MNEINNIFKWYNKFDKVDIVITTKNNSFEITLLDRQLPHLLGLHYATNPRLNGKKLYKFLLNKTDEDIYKRIEIYNPNLLHQVKQRVDNFRYFLENIEYSTLYEQTNKNTKIKSNYLLTKINDNTYIQLGLVKDKNNFDYVETFIVRGDDLYIRNSSICAPLLSIQKYNENGELEKFSFRKTPEVKEISNISIDDKLQSISFERQPKDIGGLFCNIENINNMFGDTLNIFPEDDIDLER